jgi:hypothetical protein
MPAYYEADLETFVAENAADILWKLTKANAGERFPLTPQAIQAWNAQLPFLNAGIRHLLAKRQEARDWRVLLEYSIPIVGKRIDAVLLCPNVIIVIETKTGASQTSAIRQVDEYALNLACFHEHSAGRKIVPVVVSDGPVAESSARTEFDTLIEKCRLSSTSEIGQLLFEICQQYITVHQMPIDLNNWSHGRFQPIPPIIDAAVALYSGMNVFEIGHACAARETLDLTTNTLISIVLDARTNKQKVICFTTGVPGAGKTLVGLNTVHRLEIKDFSSFLSGNGPLVNVIQEALVRDVVRREGMSRQQAALEVRAFVHNVHRFADQYYGEAKKVPSQRVVVFDEAQRAWDEQENERSGRPRVSEPEMMLEVMDRHSDWSVIVALIGGGQEINRGEAGIAEWGRALAKFPHWIVRASPAVLSERAGDGFQLFQSSKDPFPDRILEAPALHLDVCTRSIRAQRISDWVDCVLSGRKCDAAKVADTFDSKPKLTRSLETAKIWLTANRRGQTRSGLVASSSAVRLRADGLEPTFDFQQRFEWAHWFLDIHDCDNPGCDHRYCNDVRASSRLEVAATQFKIQGLELDWIGLCWGEDLTWNGVKWVSRRFNNKQWRAVKATDYRRQTYSINAYRVLMTRARQGMVIYVPKPHLDDKSRLHQELDVTAAFLMDCGTLPI